MPTTSEPSDAMDDDELFDAIGALGGAANAIADPTVDQPLKDMAWHAAEIAADN
ncbi:MAG: hypothetical protein J2P25_14460 [Nocardiopsaceae bacterium]|nr:hypothetical protein [Nocardiopsaceae bacterium]